MSRSLVMAAPPTQQQQQQPAINTSSCTALHGSECAPVNVGQCTAAAAGP